MKEWNNLKTKNIYKLTLFFILIIGAIEGCSSGNAILPTPYDRTPPTLTNTLCPNVEIASSGFVNYKPIFIVFSIENSIGENSIESDQWSYEEESYRIVSEVLEQVTEPGDSVVIFKLGPLTFKEALVFDGRVGNVSQPNIPPTLTPVPSITPTNTPDSTPEQGIYQRNTEAAAVATQGVIAVTATHIETINLCGKEIWERQFSEIATQWATTRSAAKEEFDKGLNSAETPMIENGENYSRQVYEGLQYATLAFNQECNTDKYRRCLLITFSDLSEYRSGPPSYLNPPIDLKNVEVLSVLLNCAVMFDPECKSVQGDWKEKFLSLGASSATFFNGDEIIINLIDFIRR
ncbi:MAG: hypothetical protein U0V02_20980 [Anaerolineales bacterium]